MATGYFQERRPAAKGRRRFSLGAEHRDPRSLRGEIENEFDAHLESAARELLEAGLEPPAAWEEARRRFGDRESYRAACHQIDLRHRKARRRGEIMNDLLQDLRFAGRTFRRGPGFVAASILTLALGIGANVAVFSVVYGVMLKPLPFPDPERLVMLFETNPEFGWTAAEVAPANYLDWREPNRAFADITAYNDWIAPVTLTGDHEPEVLSAAAVTGNFFAVLGVPPPLGRGLRPEETWRGHRVAVLSHRLWQRRFGSDPAVLGRTITLNSAATTVIGVMPAGFSFPFRDLDLWVPVGWRPENRATVHFRQAHNLRAVGRLRQGVTLEEARGYLATIAARLARAYPATNRVMGAGLAPLQQWVAGPRRLPLLVLLGAVALVLLVACANVANLQLARATVRTPEIALRSALGAGRWRLLRQLFTESLLLSLLGGVAGLGLGLYGTRGLLAIGPADLPRAEEIHLHGVVLAFACGATLLATLLFGLAPALQAARAEAGLALQRAGCGTASRRIRRTRDGLIAGEVALAAVLVIAATLLLDSLGRLRQVDLGLRSDHVLSASLSLPGVSYPRVAQVVAFYQELCRRARTLPGVRTAGLADGLPPTGAGWTGVFAIAGRPGGSDFHHRLVSPDYFGVFRVPLRRGRTFTEEDGKEAPGQVLVNDRFAREFFSGEDPIGKRLTMDTVDNRPAPNARWRTVIGVVGDEKLLGPAAPAPAQIYEPLPQNADQGMQLVVRTAGDPLAIVGPLRALVREMDRNLPLLAVASMDEIVSRSVASERFLTLLMALFAAIALTLAAVGVASVMAYNVAQRTREIGVRLALGAAGGQVVGQVVRQAMRPAALGIAAGLAGALAASRLLQGLLFAVRATDPTVFAAVALALTLVALAASYLPARRALRIDPMLALRHD
ncbi:MAG TPA: ABC transporter permease [Thermoanaerobaculia bacterium]|nr:ABC transporter permease [Thermoanaerobaculia bacterium]